ncbi:helix-turn-helix transcriptional regulator [Aquimarina algiphila]|uniref:helix-turn-helix transcriptional regulator n=1 Tax=Aquimarina algiphila TaxID=2047982 RepID=UPI00232AA209|nr:helix-turn-helix transcriptional regulator [Aquimarina algiphila]
MKDKKQSFYKRIGSNIKELRKLKKVGQEDLAGMISLSRSSLSNIEIGNQQPTLHAIYEISIALDCDITDILPSIKDYKSATSQIDEKYVDLLNSMSDSGNKKTLNVLKEILRKDDN